MRGCGLKLMAAAVIFPAVSVILYARMWIEIDIPSLTMAEFAVILYARMWIEIPVPPAA